MAGRRLTTKGFGERLLGQLEWLRCDLHFFVHCSGVDYAVLDVVPPKAGRHTDYCVRIMPRDGGFVVSWGQSVVGATADDVPNIARWIAESARPRRTPPEDYGLRGLGVRSLRHCR